MSTKEKEIAKQCHLQDGDHVIFQDGWGRVMSWCLDGDKYYVLVHNYVNDEWKQFYINLVTKLDHFDPKLLKPFDQVLVRDSEQSPWCISHFSNLSGSCRPYVCENFQEYQFCIPYNHETAGLVGTNNDEPEFYKL